MSPRPNNVVKVDFRQAARRIEELARAGGEEAVSGLRVIGEQIVTDVRQSRPGKGVPRDQGVLAATLRAEGPTNGRVRLIAGGASAQYALAQHERTDYAHTLGEARYWMRGIERWSSGESGNPKEEMQKIADRAIERARRRP